MLLNCCAYDKLSNGGIVSLGHSAHCGACTLHCAAFEESTIPFDLGSLCNTRRIRDGPLNAAEVSASTVELHTGRAPCSVSRLVGLQVRVSTSRAPLSAGTLLADKALITSLGGSINIANMRCSGYGHVQSGGGGLQVDGVDGVAELASGGGRVRAHAHDGLSSLVIFSEGGGVDLTLSSHITASIVVEGAAEVAATGVSEAAASTGAGDEPPASGAQGQQQRPRRFQATAQPASRQVQHADATLVDSAGGTVGSVGAVPAAAAAAGASVAPQPTARRLGPTPTANIRVHAGGTGRVTIRRLSWMEAMQERLKAKAA